MTNSTISPWNATKNNTCDVAVIGAGVAGSAAALFAAERGLSVVQIGLPAGIVYSTGVLDLMAVHSLEGGRPVQYEDPWKAIEALVADVPNHPYARMSRDEIDKAMHRFIDFLGESNLPYRYIPGKNVDLPTAVGEVKRTYAAPDSMWDGAAAMAEKKACLMLDFPGLKGFSARQFVEAMGNRWPGLRAHRMPFPGLVDRHEIYAEQAAMSLNSPVVRGQFVEAVEELAKGCDAIGLPAVLGLYDDGKVLASLRKDLGADVFELPTMPPAIQGLRLKNALEVGLQAKGVDTHVPSRVRTVTPTADGFVLEAGDFDDDQERITARGIVLATGRFLGRGLWADRTGVRETLLDLPVSQPENRAHWHRRKLLDTRGHPLNAAGIEVDDDFRPLGADGQPVLPGLHAAGAILAHQDWIRQKCGCGVAIASAFGAVKGLAGYLDT